jgi:hypothetical protein
MPPTLRCMGLGVRGLRTPRNDERSGRESIHSEWPANVRFGAHSGPKSDICDTCEKCQHRKSWVLLDHLVGAGEKGFRDG